MANAPRETRPKTPEEADKTSARGNGGDATVDAAKTGLRAGVQDRSAPQDTGDRATVRKADQDKVWTEESKERWGADQPSMQDQLTAQRKTEEKIAKDAAK